MKRILFWLVAAVVAIGWFWTVLCGFGCTMDVIGKSSVWFAMSVIAVPTLLVALVTEKRFWYIAAMLPIGVAILFDGYVGFTTLWSWMHTALPGGLVSCVGLCLLPALETRRG